MHISSDISCRNRVVNLTIHLTHIPNKSTSATIAFVPAVMATNTAMEF